MSCIFSLNLKVKCVSDCQKTVTLFFPLMFKKQYYNTQNGLNAASFSPTQKSTFKIIQNGLKCRIKHAKMLDKEMLD